MKFAATLARAWPALLIGTLALLMLMGGVLDWLRMETLQREWQTLAAAATTRPMLTATAMALALAVLVSSGLPGGVVIIIATGALFGTIAGASIGVFANVVGGCVLFAATRRLMGGSGSSAPPWVERMRATFDRSPARVALSLRLLPVFPYGALSVALAWLKCPPPVFVLASAIGALPSTLIFAALGAGIGGVLASDVPVDAEVLRQPRVWGPLLALGVLGTFALALTIVGPRFRQASGQAID